MTGQGAQGRKLQGDLRRAIVALIDGSNTPYSVSKLVEALNKQSSIPTDSKAVMEVVNVLINEGSVSVRGKGDERKVVRVGGSIA